MCPTTSLFNLRVLLEMLDSTTELWETSASIWGEIITLDKVKASIKTFNYGRYIYVKKGISIGYLALYGVIH